MKKFAPKNLPNKNNPFGYLVIVALIGASLTLLMRDELGANFQKPEEIALSEMVEKYNNSDFESIEIKNQKLTAKDADGKEFIAFKEQKSG